MATAFVAADDWFSGRPVKINNPRTYPMPLTTVSPALTPSKRRARMFKVAPLVCAVMVLVAGCGGSDDNNENAIALPPSDSFTERDLKPSTVNPAAVTSSDTSSDFHVIVTPSTDTTARNKLFVFLPGTDGVPDMYRYILRAGSGKGFHGIGLDYPNPEAVGKLCDPDNLPEASNNADSVDSCYLNVRQEIITGDNVSSLVSISDANAITTRLKDAIAYLDAQFPSEGWGQYVSNGAVDWSKVVIGGHSQGGGHAGLMAKLYPVSRACYFASPPDWNSIANRPASWEKASSQDKTSPDKQYGFAGLQDPSVPYDQLSVIWDTMGLGGSDAAVQVDSDSSFADSSPHTLTTDADPNASDDIGQPLHGITVRDAFTPVDSDGNPVFTAEWNYLCFN